MPAEPEEEEKMPVIDMVATGENIDRMRREQGMSVKDIQEFFGLGTVNTVYTWIRGKKLPSIDNLVLLADMFGTTIDDILVTRRVS